MKIAYDMKKINQKAICIKVFKNDNKHYFDYSVVVKNYLDGKFIE